MRILGLVPFALAAIVLCATAHAAGTCTSALVEEPFALPDGSVHPAGRLALCEGSGSSPVLVLQRTYVDGRPIGMFVSRRAQAEPAEEDGHYMIFHKRPGRPMRLAGYAQPSSGRTEMFLLDQRARVEVEDSIAVD